MNSKFNWIIIFVSLVTVHSDNIKLIGTDGVVAVGSFTMLCSFFIYAVSFLLNGRKDGGFSNWSDYSSCTKSRKGGIQNRTRECNNPKPINGGKNCIGIKMETRGCNHNLCPVDGGWSNWSDFSSYTKTCGGGEKSRTRKCNNPEPRNGGKDCFGEIRETQKCNNNYCIVNGDFNNWSDYSTCTKSCEGGTQVRTRECNNPKPENGGLDCVGFKTETRSCNKHKCDVDGVWSNWSDFSSCTKTCGGGEKSRTRKCNNPEPRNGGKDCFGEIRETQKCNNNYCIVNGDFNNWSDYSTCTKSCEGGTQVRTRECNNPKPENGGLDCVGFKTETRSCNKHKCDDYCVRNECCNKKWVYPRVSNLQNQLNENVFGQHLVNNLVSKAVKFHIEDKDSKKPLVMSFHGWTGTGKNFVSKIVANSLFKKGTKSKFFHQRIATVHYRHGDQLEKYKTELVDYIKNSTRECARSLFIFDAFDQMPEGLADVIIPYLDHHDHDHDHENYGKNIFLFLSNIASDIINKFTVRHLKSGKSREAITSVEMEKILSYAAMNMSSAFKNARIIKRALIDFYVPFLPLERRHIKQCAEAEIKRNNYSFDNSTLEDIANEMHYFPEEDKWFSLTGCKSVARKVSMFFY